MLGFLKPRGELVELSGRQVVFLADKPYKRDSRFVVRLSVPLQSDRKLDLDVRILSQRPGPNKRFVTVAVVETRRDFPTLKGVPVRMDRRDPIGLILKSGELPGYRAVTSDLSLGGFKTELEGELVLQDCIEITFEFDNPLGATLDLYAQVQWVESKGGGRFLTGFSFPEQQNLEENYAWFRNWFENRDDVEVKALFKPNSGLKVPLPTAKVAKTEESTEDEKGRELAPDLSVRIPFRGFLRGWAWETGDDMVVIVLEDDDGMDHWVEFPGCRGLHGRCRDRKIRLQGVRLVADSPLIREYSRSVTMRSLYHFEFLDDYARVCLDIVATGCREQKR